MKKKDFQKGKKYYVPRLKSWGMFLRFEQDLSCYPNDISYHPKLKMDNYKGIKDYIVTTHLDEVFKTDGISEEFIL